MSHEHTPTARYISNVDRRVLLFSDDQLVLDAASPNHVTAYQQVSRPFSAITSVSERRGFWGANRKRSDQWLLLSQQTAPDRTTYTSEMMEYRRNERLHPRFRKEYAERLLAEQRPITDQLAAYGFTPIGPTNAEHSTQLYELPKYLARAATMRCIAFPERQEAQMLHVHPIIMWDPTVAMRKAPDRISPAGCTWEYERELTPRGSRHQISWHLGDVALWHQGTMPDDPDIAGKSMPEHHWHLQDGTILCTAADGEAADQRNQPHVELICDYESPC